MKVGPLIIIPIFMSLSLTACHQAAAAIDPAPMTSPHTSAHRRAMTQPVGAESALDLRPVLVVNSRNKSAQLRLDISATEENGPLTPAPNLRVPKDWLVNIDCINHGTLHSTIIVPYNAAIAKGKLPPEVIGRGADGVKQSFSFRTMTMGTYAIVCTSSGHHDGILTLIHVRAATSTPLLT